MRTILASVTILGFALPVAAQEGVQALQVIRPGTGGTFLEWQGHPGRTYFVQVSDQSAPLQKWDFAPLIEVGAGQTISYEVAATAERAFFRLKSTDVPLPSGVLPEDADPDYDGLTSEEELLASQTDPVEWDTDRDGLPDGWEVDHGLDPNDDGSGDIANGGAGDPDVDGLSNLAESMWGTNPVEPDTDGDGLGDGNEIFLHGSNPLSTDGDVDGLSDSDEVLLHGTNPLAWDSDFDTVPDGDEILVYLTDPLQPDTDADGMPDGWELDHGLDPVSAADSQLDPDQDGLPSVWEYRLRLDPHSHDTGATGVADGNRDADRDELTNSAEVNQTQTDPANPDTDADGMPDGWEIAHSLDPTDGAGGNGTAGDGDDDGVSNFDEWLNATSPHSADTDSDGSNDAAEIQSGGNPADAADAGIAPPAGHMVEVPFMIDDPSGSHSERWKMTITGKGPDDTRVFSLACPGFGQPATKTFRLRKWNRYEITISHLATDPSNPDTNGRPDYDWAAGVDSLPAGQAQSCDSETAGANNYFMVANHWFADNAEAVLTTEKHGNDNDIVSGKKAVLVPVSIRDNEEASGVDKDSLMADPGAGGRKDHFWIMAPAGGAGFTDDMHFTTKTEFPARIEIRGEDLALSPSAVVTLDQAAEPMVSWRSTGPDTAEVTPSYLLGVAAEAVPLPVRVMRMKKRTVRVALHGIASQVPGRPDDAPDLMPSAAALQAKLNEIFGWQVNAYFEVIRLDQEQVEFDVANTSTWPGFTFASGTPPPVPGNRCLDFKFWGQAEESIATANRPPDYDIHVYVIGGGTPMWQYGVDGSQLVRNESFAGRSTRLQDAIGICIIDGDRDCLTYDGDGNPVGYYYPPNARTVDAVISTIAHETGHVMVGDGHPDEGGGPAPLQGTDRTRRLMCSGPNRAPDAKLLVKAEWDAAEAWLISRGK